MSDNKMQFGVAGADDFKSDHAALLNALDDMQRSGAYALRHGVLRQAELLIVSQERAIADLRARLALSKERLGHAVANAVKYSAQLARQQAPVGDSVDTPEFRILLWDFQKDSGSVLKIDAIIAHITAWKDAQLARERQGANCEDDPVGAFQAEARQAKLDDFIASTRSAQAQGEPVARDPDLKTWPARIWLQHQFEYTPAFEVAYKACSEITWCQDSVDRYDIEYVRADLAGPAAQADEVRDAARYRWLRDPYNDAIGAVGQSSGEELDASIDAFMRTTAADNQTKGE